MVLVKAMKAYERHRVGKKDQEALRALSVMVEAYKRNCVTKSSQEAWSLLEQDLKVPQCEILEMGLRAYTHELLRDRANAAYRDLKADPKAWEREQQERRAWDATLLDGLE